MTGVAALISSDPILIENDLLFIENEPPVIEFGGN
jgi:hypothetical protein